MRGDALRIGLDLDNTLINYDELFRDLAVRCGFVPSDFRGSKRDIRDRIRLLPDGELEWQRLQAQAYGQEIGGATAAEGAVDFIRRLRASGAELAIVSHKTAFANMGSENVNLHDAARGWLQSSGMLGPHAVPEANLYFEETRARKIERIVALRCTHFIDDLVEVFDDPSFPEGVERLLFTGDVIVPGGRYRAFSSFDKLADALVAG